MKLQESQTVEFKEAWQDEHMKTVCAFANADGGVLYIGVNDNAEIVGVKNIKKLIEDLPNKTMSAFSIAADVTVEEENGKQYVKMTVPKSTVAVSHHGRFYTRSGSTTQELKGGKLQKLLLNANNLYWDEIGVDSVSYRDIDNHTVARFVSRALEHNRLPQNVDGKNIKQLFENLKLTTEDGKLTRAAILLFGKHPNRIFRWATVKIGRFRGTDLTNLITQDLVEGNLFTILEQTILLLRSKYLWSPISYRDMVREEPLEIPEAAIREAVLNAIIHKDYTSGESVYLRVCDPTVEIWNEGELQGMDVKDLTRNHRSYKRNPTIAEIFYRAGYIEAWGRGTLMIIDETTKAGMPKPTFSAHQGGLSVTFKRNQKLLSESGMNKTEHKFKPSERQQKAVDYVREHGSISNKIYQELVEVSRRTATRDLIELVQNMIFEKSGTSGESIRYFLAKS